MFPTNGLYESISVKSELKIKHICVYVQMASSAYLELMALQSCFTPNQAVGFES